MQKVKSNGIKLFLASLVWRHNGVSHQSVVKHPHKRVYRHMDVHDYDAGYAIKEVARHVAGG